MSRSVSSNRLSKPPDRGSTGHSPAREIVELLVSKQHLDGTDVLSLLEQVSGKRMPAISPQI